MSLLGGYGGRQRYDAAVPRHAVRAARRFGVGRRKVRQVVDTHQVEHTHQVDTHIRLNTHQVDTHIMLNTTPFLKLFDFFKCHHLAQHTSWPLHPGGTRKSAPS